MAAKESTLARLHEKLADAYLDALDGDEVSPALLTSAAKFLKDNGIEAEIGNEQLEELKEKTGEVLKFPFDPKEAAAS